MSLGRLRRKRAFNDTLFFFVSVALIVSLFICFLSMKNDCIFIKNEINHLKNIRQSHASKVKVLSSKVKKMTRQDRIEELANKKFNFYIPNPESLIVYLDN